MITSWRLCNIEHASLSGEGAALHGGRWNAKGLHVVYSAESLALATLEAFVHLDRRPDNQVYMRITFSEGLVKRIEDLYELPVNWKEKKSATCDLGSRWLRERMSAVLSVPSAVVPLSRNFLINPKHSHFPSIGCSEPVSFVFDDRLLRQFHQGG